MSSLTASVPPTQEPVRATLDERAPASRPRDQVRRIGQVRLPLALDYRPRATLYRLPDGRPLWVVRLWEVDRPVRHVVTTEQLRAYARRNGLPSLAREVEELDSLGRR